MHLADLVAVVIVVALVCAIVIVLVLVVIFVVVALVVMIVVMALMMILPRRALVVVLGRSLRRGRERETGGDQHGSQRSRHFALLRVPRPRASAGRSRRRLITDHCDRPV